MLIQLSETFDRCCTRCYHFPELFFNEQFVKLFQNKTIKNRLWRFVFDEAHCVLEWKEFCEEYGWAGQVCNYHPDISIYATSATLPPQTLHEVREILSIRPQHTTIIHCSNKQKNLHLIVRRMKFTQSSYQDIQFLVQQSLDSSFKKFMLFCDKRTTCKESADYLRGLLGKEHQYNIMQSWHAHQL